MTTLTLSNVKLSNGTTPFDATTTEEETPNKIKRPERNLFIVV